MTGGYPQVCPMIIIQMLPVITHTLLELKLRRPGMDKYRLDHLLEKKAKEGVKIYIIL